MTTNSASSSDATTPPMLKTEVLQKIIGITLNKDLIDERKTQSHASEFVIEGIALRGEITVLYASPNTGKTLITLSLLAQNKLTNDADIEIFHVNLDDSFDGLTTKAEIGLAGGYRVLNPNNFTDPLSTLSEIFTALIESDGARDTVFVLDTVKKFTDPMDKKASSAFMRGCRSYTQAGGTTILLAHNNKQTPNNPTPTPGGTSDLQDDADCVYVMSTAKKQPSEQGTQYFVKFENRKSRGPNVSEACFSFIKDADANYTNMFWSVAPKNTANTNKHSSNGINIILVESILSLLSDGPKSQKELIANLSNEYGKNKVRNHLKVLSDPKSDKPKLIEYRGPKNTAVYKLN